MVARNKSQTHQHAHLPWTSYGIIHNTNCGRNFLANLLNFSRKDELLVDISIFSNWLSYFLQIYAKDKGSFTTWNDKETSTFWAKALRREVTSIKKLNFSNWICWIFTRKLYLSCTFECITYNGNISSRYFYKLKSLSDHLLSILGFH